MNLLAKMLRSLVAWVLPRPLLVLGLTFLSAAACLAVGFTRLDVQTDQLELISSDHPLIALDEKLEPFNFDGKTTFTAVIEAPTPERGLSFLRALVSRIQSDPAHYQEVVYRVNPDLVKQWALLYLDRKELLQIGRQVEDHAAMVDKLSREPDLINFFRLVNQEMATRMVGELFTGFLDDGGPKDKGRPEDEPFDLGFLIQTLDGLASYFQDSPRYVSPWTSFFKSDAWDMEKEGYFWEGDKRFLFLSVIPKKKGDGFNKAQDALDDLRKTIKELEAAFPGVRGGVTGQEALNYDEMETALTDMSNATWVSLLGVAILLVLFFRGLRRAWIQMVSLGVGLCWTLGWTTLFIGHLNILSVVFAPLLCGLGVDYGIHWFARYEEEERAAGSDRRSVIVRVTERSGPGIFLAGLSTAFSFLPLVLTGFRGLMELGLITGVGIVLILAADFITLPALGVLAAGTRKNGPRGGTDDRRNLISFTPRTAHLVLGAMGILCVASVWGARGVRFDLNPLRLQAPNAESVVWEKILVEKSERSVLSAAVFASSPEEVIAKSQALKVLPTVSEVQNIFSFLPEDQEEKIALLKTMLPKIPEMCLIERDSTGEDAQEIADLLERIRFKLQEEQAAQWGAQRPLLEQMARVRSLAGAILKGLRESPNALRILTEYRHRFQADLADTLDFLREGASAVPMTIDDVPRVLREQFSQNGQYLVRVFPKGSVWEEEQLSRFINDIWSVDKEAIGDPVSLYVFATAFKRACLLASVYAVVAISLLLALSLRSLRLTLLALVPLLVGTVFTVGIMGLSGIDFNLANSMFMPLVVGAGVEYGVVILQRWREGRMVPGHLPFSTGKGSHRRRLDHHRGIWYPHDFASPGHFQSRLCGMGRKHLRADHCHHHRARHAGGHETPAETG